jgi:hypothetical protein
MRLLLGYKGGRKAPKTGQVLVHAGEYVKPTREQVSQERKVKMKSNESGCPNYSLRPVSTKSSVVKVKRKLRYKLSYGCN